MPVSRRRFVGNTFALGLLASLLPAEEAKAIAQESAPASSPEDFPHDPYEFWNGFFDSVNPATGHRGRDVGQGLADSQLQTQYLQYHNTQRRLRWAYQVDKEELLDHDGDVAVSIMLSQFRPGETDQKVQASQLRVDATQTSPYMNLFAPLAWTAIASLMPTQAGKIPSLDQLGFKSDQAMTANSHILLTQGSGKLAVNISRAPNDSMFLKIMKVMISGAKMAAPLISLPAISIPALSTFSEAFAYWEDRTRFLMNGNLMRAIATQQAFSDPHEASYMGLVPGDYVMVAQKHAEELGKEIPNLDMEQGYLVAKNGDTNVPVSSRAQATLPHITYATMRIAISPVAGSSGGSKSSESGGGGESSDDGGGESSGGGGRGKSAGGGGGGKQGKGKESGSGSGSGKGKSGSGKDKSGSGEKPQ